MAGEAASPFLQEPTNFEFRYSRGQKLPDTMSLTTSRMISRSSPHSIFITSALMFVQSAALPDFICLSAAWSSLGMNGAIFVWLRRAYGSVPQSAARALGRFSYNFAKMKTILSLSCVSLPLSSRRSAMGLLVFPPRVTGIVEDHGTHAIPSIASGFWFLFAFF